MSLNLSVLFLVPQCHPCIVYRILNAGGTIRYCQIRWDVHTDVNKDSEPAKHLPGNIEHEFSWYVLTRAPKNTFKRIILEAY